MSVVSPPREQEYSRAYPAFVESEDDIVGLLAYALYKAAINERKRLGLDVSSPGQRNPQRLEVDLHRSQAERYLRAFARTAIDAERAAIVQDGVGAAVGDINRAIEARTGFWWNVTIGVVAWLISIALTILVAYSLPDWVKSLVQHVAR